ncbi:histone H1x [Carlito syrichta]|uniref:Histone H1x n=1 Tax=Carlito syrichta TaxID=1868482 RepID=A0A1U7U7G1_CARSF|nr:histone H1x [Carlito syrichta]
MSVELEEALPLTTAEGAAKKATKAGGSAALSPAKKRKNSKKKNQPGKYSQLVVETIRRLGERNGSSLARIYTEAKKVPWFDQQNGRTYLKYSIKALVQNDTLLGMSAIDAQGIGWWAPRGFIRRPPGEVGLEPGAFSKWRPAAFEHAVGQAFHALKHHSQFSFATQTTPTFQPQATGVWVVT